jgi:arylsulfatase A-like enzyme
VRRFATCLALWLGSGCGGAPSPNLLLVSIDTLRADRLACYGGPAQAGVALCALAEHGTRYAWAFATAPATAPSVASLLTARYPRAHGVGQDAESTLPEEVPTLAERLRAAGYATAAFVSNPVLERGRRLDRGFDVYDAHLPRRESNRPHYRERSAGETTDAALAWLRSAREPWFAWVHYQDPHGPYEPPDAPPARDGPGGTELPLLADDSGSGGIPAYQAIAGLRSREAYEARYLAEIRYLDRELARLVRSLDDAGGRPPFLVVTADHGEAFGEDGFHFAHGHSVGLDQIRVPLVVRPGEPGPPAVIETAVSLVDVAPTLLRAAGLEPGALVGSEGRPLPTLRGAPEARSPIFAEHLRQVAVVHAGRYFARDRRPGATAAADGRPWGRKAPALPARAAALPPDPGAPVPYEVSGPGDQSDLEPLLAEFLARPSAAPRERAEVPPETRARLRALGYEDREGTE